MEYHWFKSYYERKVEMNATHKRKRVLVGGAFGAGIAIALISALTLFAGVGIAASSDKPSVVNPPHIWGRLSRERPSLEIAATGPTNRRTTTTPGFAVMRTAGVVR